MSGTNQQILLERLTWIWQAGASNGLALFLSKSGGDFVKAPLCIDDRTDLSGEKPPKTRTCTVQLYKTDQLASAIRVGSTVVVH